MKFEGRYELQAGPDRVWALLNDPAVLRESVPGCEALTQTSPVKYDATVLLKIGVIRARFQGYAEMTEQRPPNHCLITFKGSGGIAGMARGEATVTLSPTVQGTELTYVTDVVIGGKIAQLGSRLIEGTARKLADQFFSNFADQIDVRV